MSTMHALDLYIAPDGHDKNDGRSPQAGAPGTGPLASLEAAFEILRERKRQGAMPGSAAIFMRGGTYRMARPLVLKPAHSLPVTVQPYEKEIPVLSGGRDITGWEETVHGGRRAWTVTLEAVRDGRWYFRSLYVNNARRERPQLPKQGLSRIVEVPGMPIPSGWGTTGYDRFRIEPGLMKTFQNLADIDVLAFHFWLCERLPVAAFDPQTEMITTALKSRVPLVESWGETLAPCRLENVGDALSEPGEWYLSRRDGRLTYLPLDGETLENTVVTAPVALQLLKFKGDPEAKAWVEWITFKDIEFRHTDWARPDEPHVEKDTAWHDPRRPCYNAGRRDTGSAAQSDNDISGAIFFKGARNCTLEGCTVANVGWYGVEIGDGCRAVALRGCELADLGAGGVKLNGASYQERNAALETGNNRITDCHIHHGGRVFCAAVGILNMHSYANHFLHNDIHDFYYSGISIGWQWHFGPGICRDIRVEYNHIHHLGSGMLSDMGGIYTLGVQGGTVLRNNHIHDIEAMSYGAWCIYPDEGSSHLVIENNVCHSTNREIFHQHYGRENLVRNNIFAFGAHAVVAYSSFVPPDPGLRLVNNILLSRGEPHFLAGYALELETRGHESNFNLLYRYDGKPLRFTKKTGATGDAGEGVLLEQWRAYGYDRQSIVADPLCADPDRLDFSLDPQSPAILKLGFEPIDLRDVGPRPRPRWNDYPVPHRRAVPGME